MPTDESAPRGCTSALNRHLQPGLFRALADSNRLILLGRLAVASHPLTVSELSSCCGVHLSGVSRHLAILREARVIRADKQGREVRYCLDCEVLTHALRGLADAIDDCRANCCKASDIKEKKR